MRPIPTTLIIAATNFAAIGGLAGCGTEQSETYGHTQPNDLRLNEVVSNNAGVWIDEQGETDDYIEVFNASSEPRNLGRYRLEDSTHDIFLPRVVLAPNERVLLWADDSPEQGPLHIGMKLDAQGELLTLRKEDGSIVDRVDLPPLAEHHAYERIPDANGKFVDCAWATPTKPNGNSCGPLPLPDLPETLEFAPYVWSSPFPAQPLPLAITELALRPASFIELLNTSNDDVNLTEYALTLAPSHVGVDWPKINDGAKLSFPRATLPAHERIAVPVTGDDLFAFAGTPNFEGVVTLWSLATGMASDRAGFSQYPPNAALARVPDPTGPFRFCKNATPTADNDACVPLESRPVGDHVRDLNTPGDFLALANSQGAVGASAVEFIVDMESGDQVTLLNSANWALHFEFIREVIDGQTHLDRCIPEQLKLFDEGWSDFSKINYFNEVGERRYLLGNLVKYAGTDIQTVEFSPGDAISPEQMRRAFFTAMLHVDDPTAWAMRPQDQFQLDGMRKLEGQVPIVDPNAPFRGLTFQPLVPTVGYGTLRFVPSNAINEADIGPRDIVVTDQVPLNIPFIGGLITETFQTPLAHVNVLSRGRGTPNMALKHARENPQLKPLFGKLVRLEVGPSSFTITEADNADAAAFWDSKKPKGSPAVPRLDATVRGIQPLANHGIADIPSIGGKAAQLAELGRISLVPLDACGFHPSSPVTSEAARVPRDSFAIPVAHSIEHFEKSGAKAKLAQFQQDAAFKADPKIRDERLNEIRADILKTPLDPELLASVKTQILLNWPGQRVRFRSSSNTEDLPNFNGAGLYISDGLHANASTAEIATAIREVWASLWRLRAYDERGYYNIDQSAVAMAVLVQEAFPSEKANGVAISRDILEPASNDLYYINAQAGEALVTNPAPGVNSDEYTYSLSRWPYTVMHSRSSLVAGPVLSENESRLVACNLARIHEHFRALIDPDKQNPWFAMDIEFKFIGNDRQLVIKQARPYSFGSEAPVGWCDLT